MLRVFVSLLVLANLAVWAGGQPWLGDLLGTPRPAPRQDIHPGRVAVLAPEGPTSQRTPAPDGVTAPAAASAPNPPAAAACLEAGPFAVAQLPALKALMSELPTGSWSSQTVLIKGSWMIHMGPFADADLLERKRMELRRMRDLPFEDVKAPSPWAPGLSLGRFNQESQANAALEAMRQRGIRTARVVALKPAQEGLVLKIPKADGPLSATAKEVKLPAGRRFAPCAA